MMRRAVFTLSIDGRDVSSAFDPHLIELTIKDHDGGKADTLEATLDDAGGFLELPRSGARIEGGIGWQDEGAVVTFEGVTDEPRSTGARGGGQILSITAKSADPKGKLKSTQEMHADRGSFGSVAKRFGEAAGLSVSVTGAAAAIERDYWAMARESFQAWGLRMARELGLTFKIIGDRAVFVDRNAGLSASGKPLVTIHATNPGNVLHWSMTPVLGRSQYQTFKRRWYDVKAARYREETVDLAPEGGAGAAAILTGRFDRPSGAHARAQAGSDKTEAEREQGGGSITLDGEPAALSQAPCIVSGLREGIDGTYRIESATHALSRSRGFTTELALKQPQDKAGTDSRASATPKSVGTPGFAGPSARA